MEQENVLSAETLKEIEAKVAELKETNKVKRVFPFYVLGDECDSKEIYIAYFRQPSFVAFTKYMSLAQKESVGAMRELARDCFLDGDKELIKDDSLFIYGLMPHLSQLIQLRSGGLANFSKSGK